MKKKWGYITLAGLLLLGACSDGEASSSEESGVQTLTVAVPPTSKPLSWEENGKLTGYEPDILRLVDEKLEDYNFDLVGVSDSAAEIGLDTGKYDMIAQGLFKSDERAEKYLIPDENNGASLMRIYKRNDSEDIETMKDLVDKNIVPTTPTGGVFNFIMDWNEKNPDHEIEFQTSDAGLSYADRLREVESGKYDALILPSNLGQNEIIKSQDMQIVTTEPVEVFPTYFMIYKNDENIELKDDISKALAELKDEGKLSELSLKYYGEDVFQFTE